MRVAKACKFIKDAPNSHVYEGRNFVLPKRALFILGMPVPISLSCKMGNYILVALSFGPIEGLLKYNLK